MIETLKGIVLGVVRHNDTGSVVTLYTPTRGRVSLLSTAGQGRAGKLRRAALMPLTVVETQVRFNNIRELQRMGRVAMLETFPALYSDPVKSCVAMFVSEFLSRLLRDTVPDPAQWEFIRHSVRVLEESGQSGVANFHIAFLTGLTTFAGIRPDVSGAASEGVFDMRAGEFTRAMPLHTDVLMGAEARFVTLLDRMTFSNMHRFRFSRAQRTEVLGRLLQYYSIHLPGTSALRSVDILRAMFD